VVLVVLPFLIGGKLETMWEILGIYIFHYAEQARPSGKLPQWLRVEHGGALLMVTALLTAMTWAVARERKDRGAQWRLFWLFLAAVLAFASVVVQARYFTYHFVVTSSFVAALCVLGLRELARNASAPSWPQLGGVALAIGLAFYAGPRWTSGRDQSYARFTRDLIGYLRGTTPREAMLAPFVGRRPLDSVVYSERVAKRINEFKRPGDTLCTRGFLTPLYPLTGLRCTSRHIVEDNVPTGLPDWKREYKTTLEQRPPTFMVTFSDRPKDVAYLKGRGYKQVAREGMFVILSTRDVSKPSPANPSARVADPSDS
jgi:hypothetical protein